MNTIRTILCILLFAGSATAQADNYQYLTVNHSGQATQFEVSQIQKITFDEENMLLTLSTGNVEKLPLASLTKMFFTDNALSSIAASQSSKSKVSLQDGVLRVDVAEGEHVSIYNLSGVEVMSVNEPLTMNIDTLKKDIYIVKIGNETKKIMTK